MITIDIPIIPIISIATGVIIIILLLYLIDNDLKTNAGKTTRSILWLIIVAEIVCGVEWGIFTGNIVFTFAGGVP